MKLTIMLKIRVDRIQSTHGSVETVMQQKLFECLGYNRAFLFLNTNRKLIDFK